MSFLLKVIHDDLRSSFHSPLSGASINNSQFYFTGILVNRSSISKLLRLESQSSNTSILSAAYCEWGIDLVNHLKGEFSFAIWDDVNKKLFASRDHLGIVPLYYYYQDEVLVVSPDANEILNQKEVKRDLNDNWPLPYLLNLNGHYEKTINKGLYRLSTASYLIYQDSKLSIHRFWNPDYASKQESKEDFFEGFAEKLRTAIKKRINENDNVVGAELSGGIDSSTIVAFLKGICDKSNRELTTFSEVFPKKLPPLLQNMFDEREDMQSVIQACKIGQSFSIDNNGRHLIDFLELSNQVHFEPSFGKISLFASGIYQKAKDENIQTIFSGFGGDEIVSSNQIVDFKTLVEEKDFTTFFKLLFKKYGSMGIPLPHAKSFIKLIRDLSNVNIATLRPRSYKTGLEKLFIQPAMLEESKIVDQYTLEKVISRPIRYFQQFEEKIFGPQKLPHRLHACYAMTKHFGVNLRYPLLDVDLIEYYFSIPYYLKSNYTNRRQMMRRSITNILPDNIIQKKSKKGSGTPSDFVITLRDQNELLNRLEDISQHNRIHDFVDLKKIVPNERKLMANKKRPYHSSATGLYLLARKLEEY